MDPGRLSTFSSFCAEHLLVMGPCICIYVQRKSEQPCLGTVLAHRPSTVVVDFKIGTLALWVLPPSKDFNLSHPTTRSSLAAFLVTV